MTTTKTNPKRELVKVGEMRVPVTRPSATPLPAGFSNWGYMHNGIKLWTNRGNPSQDVLVSYSIYRDTILLRGLVERARRNRSGTSVRGWAKANASGHIDEGLTSGNIRSLVRHAANLASHRSIEGPASATVKLLEQPEPFESICANCKRVFADHVIWRYRTRNGDWVERDGKRVWDNDIPSYRTLATCPGQELPQEEAS